VLGRHQFSASCGRAARAIAAVGAICLLFSCALAGDPSKMGRRSRPAKGLSTDALSGACAAMAELVLLTHHKRLASQRPTVLLESNDNRCAAGLRLLAAEGSTPPDWATVTITIEPTPTRPPLVPGALQLDNCAREVTKVVPSQGRQHVDCGPSLTDSDSNNLCFHLAVAISHGVPAQGGMSYTTTVRCVQGTWQTVGGSPIDFW